MYKKGKEQYNEPPLSITQLNNYTHFLSPVFSVFQGFCLFCFTRLFQSISQSLYYLDVTTLAFISNT